MAFIRQLVSQLRHVLRRPITKDAAALTLGQYIAAGAGLITTLFSARLLGPVNYGVAAIVLSYPSLFLSLVSFKSVAVTTRYIAIFRSTGDKERLRAVTKIGYTIDLIAFSLPFLIAALTGEWVIHHIYKLPGKMFWLIMIYAASFPMLSFRGTSFAILSAFQEFRLVALLQALDSGITMGLVVPLLIMGFGIPGLILGRAIGHTIIGIMALLMASSILSRNGIHSWWKASFKEIRSLRQELVSFFGWNYLMVTLSGLLREMPIMLLGKLRGPEDAGFYRLAMSLQNLGSHPQNALRRIMYPKFTDLLAKGINEEDIKKSLKRWFFKGGLPLSLIILIIPFLRIIVPLVFGEGYRPMVSGTQLVVVIVAIEALFFWLIPYYYAQGRIALWTKAYAVYTTLVLGFGFFCIQRWGFLGMVAVLGVCKLCFNLLMAKIAISRHLMYEVYNVKLTK